MRRILAESAVQAATAADERTPEPVRVETREACAGSASGARR
jgi:hypothetical protein